MSWKSLLFALPLGLLLNACASRHAGETVPPMAEAPTLSWDEVATRPLPPAGERIAYGPEPLQFGELRLPPGAGPFPVVALLHGGCWLSDFDYAHITPLAAALTREGYATWTVEYRRLGNPGGGWPNTFLDAGRAVDHLRALANRYALDLSRLVFAGHSAGGQLALWLAARGKLAPASALHSDHPLLPSAVIGLAAITDLAAYRVGPVGSCHSSVDPLIGGTPSEQPSRYAQTSPLALLPLTIPVWLLQGTRDSVVSADSARTYAAAAGAQARLRLLNSAGHFEMVVPEGETRTALRAALREALP